MDGRKNILREGAGALDVSGAPRYRTRLNFERRSLLRGRLDGRKISDGLCREARR